MTMTNRVRRNGTVHPAEGLCEHWGSLCASLRFERRYRFLVKQCSTSTSCSNSGFPICQLRSNRLSLPILFLRSDSMYSVLGSIVPIGHLYMRDPSGCSCPGGPRPRLHFLKLIASNLRGVRCVPLDLSALPRVSSRTRELRIVV